VLPTSTNVKKNYYQTTGMYLYNRCQTFEQREFNFVSGVATNPETETDLELSAQLGAKPGSALAITNFYVAQCNPNSTIELGGQLALFDALTQSLFDRGIITQQELNSFKTLNISSVREFITLFLDKLPNNKRVAASIALDEISANPYLNSLIYAGPSNPKGCKRVYYKPNNPQFAKQGAVSSSTQILKTNVDTINTNAAITRRLKGAGAAVSLAVGGATPDVPFIYKFKAPTCQPSTYTGNPFFFQGQHQNKKICSKADADNDRLFVSINQHSAGNYIGSTLP
jgi:hypothetical protein